MPIKYTIIEGKKLVLAVGQGLINFDDLARHIDTLAHDPKYISPMKKLVDYRNASLVELKREEAYMFTQKKAQLKDKFANEMCAIITKNDLDFGTSRVHGARIEASDIHTNVFRNIKDALKWLEAELDETDLHLD
ncbi:MAG: hypothetical protein KKA70_15795 [Proteobacteria bacterium]|nr:hypothetical protein [Pseudomonadota bacterium]